MRKSLPTNDPPYQKSRGREFFDTAILLPTYNFSNKNVHPWSKLAHLYECQQRFSNIVFGVPDAVM